MSKLTPKQKRCQDCVALIKGWKCDECFGQSIEDIDDCPEGCELEKMEEIEKKAKENKIKLGASVENKEEKPKKSRTVKISNEKSTLFADICSFLDEKYDYSIEKDNKLLIVNINDKKIKIDFIQKTKGEK